MKFFNKETFVEFSICMKEKAIKDINERHLARLKKGSSLAHRTNSSKIRWDELNEMAIEFNYLNKKYNLI
jgi:hypothetical protein